MVKTEGLATRSFRGSMSCRIRLHWMYWIPLRVACWTTNVSSHLAKDFDISIIAHHSASVNICEYLWYEMHKGTISMWSAIEATAAKTEEEGGQRCWRNLEDMEDLEGERNDQSGWLQWLLVSLVPSFLPAWFYSLDLFGTCMVQSLPLSQYQSAVQAAVQR